MARLGGLNADSFSPRDRLSSAGLGSILRDPKILSGTARATVLLGLATHSPAESVTKSPPARSVASSPVESNALAAEADDSDDLKEEDVWAAETRSWQDGAKGSELVGKSDLRWPQSVKKDLSLGVSDMGKQRVNSADVLRPSRRRADKGPGLTDAFANAGAMGLSPLSRMGESSSSRQTPTRPPTASWAIPQLGVANDSRRRAERQSAPVNVPDWSKILGSEIKGKRNGMLDKIWMKTTRGFLHTRFWPESLPELKEARSQCARAKAGL